MHCTSALVWTLESYAAAFEIENVWPAICNPSSSHAMRSCARVVATVLGHICTPWWLAVWHTAAPGWPVFSSIAVLGIQLRCSAVWGCKPAMLHAAVLAAPAVLFSFVCERLPGQPFLKLAVTAPRCCCLLTLLRQARAPFSTEICRELLTAQRRGRAVLRAARATAAGSRAESRADPVVNSLQE